MRAFLTAMSWVLMVGGVLLGGGMLFMPRLVGIDFQPAFVIPAILYPVLGLTLGGALRLLISIDRRLEGLRGSA